MICLSMCMFLQRRKDYATITMSEKRSAPAQAEPEVTEKKAKMSPEEEGDNLAEEEDIEEEEEEEDGEEDDGEEEVRTFSDDFLSFRNYEHS